MIGERGEWGALNAARTGLPLHPSDVCVCWGYRGGDVRVLKVQRSGCVCIVGNMYTCMHQGHTCILAVQRALTLHAFLPSSQIRTRWPHNNVGWSCWLLPKLCCVWSRKMLHLVICCPPSSSAHTNSGWYLVMTPSQYQAFLFLPQVCAGGGGDGITPLHTCRCV